MKLNRFSIASFISMGFSLVFARIAYLRSALPYNDQGRYFDGMVVWDEQAASVYLLLALGTLCVTAVLAHLHCRKNSSSNKKG